MTPAEDASMDALDRFWDGLTAGSTTADDGLDAGDALAIRQFLALSDVAGPPADAADRVWQRIVGHGELRRHPADPLPPSVASALPRPAAPRSALPDALKPSRWRWLSAQLATAALLLLTLGGLYVVFFHQRHDGDRPTTVPASPSTATETLVDATVDDLPTGHATVALLRWRFRPGPTSVTEAALDGPAVVVVDAGSLVVTIGGTATTLESGDRLTVPAGQEHVLRNPGAVDAVALVVYLATLDDDLWWQTDADPTLVSRDWTIDSTSDALPSGPVRLTLERLTMPPGAVLPTYEATDLDWIGVEAGRLGLTLEGETLPHRWQSGQERVFAGQQPLAKFRAGWRVALRNAADVPLVLYRLRIVPAQTPIAPVEQVSSSAPA